MAISPKDPLQSLPGVGPARARALERLGLCTAEDLLRWFPRSYEDRRRVYPIRLAPEGESACVAAMVAEAPRLSRIRRGLDVTKVLAVDESASIVLTFFNQSYVKNTLRPGVEYVFYGKVEGNGLARQMTNPSFERSDRQRFTGCIFPVYSLTAGLTGRFIADLVRRVLDNCAIPGTLTPRLLEEYKLVPASVAYRNIHFPDSFEALAEARRRLVFEEFFFLTLGMALLRKRREGGGFACEQTDYGPFLAGLPFSLTAAQTRVLSEIAADLASGRPMNRLVQGDVGSGKTAVAAAAAYMVCKSGYQSAMMAPTELLAQQHYKSLSVMLSPMGVRLGLLTGSMKASEKKEIYGALAAGELDFIIGTHALLSGPVVFRSLGLVVVDEQHRFGVLQRSALTAKGTGDSSPHLLVMSATPIPRTLSLIVYGDLDVSAIDELPPGRIPVKTYVVGEDKRARLYDFIRRLTGEGRQVYVVCPMVEESADGEGASLTADLKAAGEYAEALRTEVFPNLRIGVVHGKMKAADKESVMEDFSLGNLDVLVSTTVIELGVDVANAALMVVENAERFGLSQLHQLRGRVGRGDGQSYCVLVTDSKNPESLSRLKVLTSTTDGFQIAEEDLRLRGPGDFIGSRQHGLPSLRVADLAGDTRVLLLAKAAADALLNGDPDLSSSAHRPLFERVKNLFIESPDIFN